jgi:hypothetical protein
VYYQGDAPPFRPLRLPTLCDACFATASSFFAGRLSALGISKPARFTQVVNMMLHAALPSRDRNFGDA